MEKQIKILFILLSFLGIIISQHPIETREFIYHKNKNIDSINLQELIKEFNGKYVVELHDILNLNLNKSRINILDK